VVIFIFKRDSLGKNIKLIFFLMFLNDFDVLVLKIKKNHLIYFLSKNIFKKNIIFYNTLDVFSSIHGHFSYVMLCLRPPGKT
jgi:hypothetical protein